MPHDIKPTATLRMDPSADFKTVVLERVEADGKTSSIILTDKDVFALGQNMSQFANQLAAEQNSAVLEKDPDLRVAYWAVVKGAHMGVDLHQSAVHLALKDEYGQWSRFSLQPTLAKTLAEAFVQRAEEVESAPKTKN